VSLLHRIGLLALCCALDACSIHPLPEDVTGVNTVNIVRKVRCEARDAVVDELLQYLHNNGYPNFTEKDLYSIKLFKWQEPVKSTLPYFEDAGLVLAFTLDMAETDGITASADLIKPVAHGTFTLSPTAGDTVKRENMRVFTVVDNFMDLIEIPNNSKNYCNFTPSGPNFQYPMVGQIGLHEIIDTFLKLALFNGLGAKATDATGQTVLARGLPAMADTLTFTTTLTAGLPAKVVFSPVGTAFQDMDANIMPSAMRVDTHSVIVGLGLPVLPPPPGTHTALLERRAALLSTQFTPALTITSPIVTSGEDNAKAAVDEQILRFQIGKVPIVGP